MRFFKIDKCINYDGLVVNIDNITSFYKYSYDNKYYLKIYFNSNHESPFFKKEDCEKAYNDLLAAINNKGEK